MKEKKLICNYCGGNLEAKTTRAEFCSDKCRVYWNREQAEKNKLPEAPKIKKTATIYEKLEARIGLPKNLDELKKLCPPELTGFDKSEWISKKRQEYSI